MRVFLAAVMEHEQMDGQALMLLNLETAKERLNLSLGSALKLCSIALKLKHHALSVNAA